MDVVSFDLGQSNKTHVNAEMKVNIVNPGLIEVVPLGVLEFDILYENSSMGFVTSNNMTLKRGVNTVWMFGMRVSSLCFFHSASDSLRLHPQQVPWCPAISRFPIR